MLDAVNPQGNISEQLENIVRGINNSVYEQYSADNGISKAGATMVLAYIFKNRIYWATVGDSRLYCFRNGNLLQMNEDHDYKNQLYREYINESGNLQDIEEDEQKDSLVCFIGKKEIPYVDVSRRGYKIKPNDTFILCSDGVYNGISQDAMKDILSNYVAQTASDKIISNILSSRFPGQDNMTVMVIKCERKK
jgi:protein phosphatase